MLTHQDQMGIKIHAETSLRDPRGLRRIESRASPNEEAFDTDMTH